MHNMQQVHVAIAGVGGNMGRQLIQAAIQMDYITLIAALEHEDSELLGIDVCKLIGGTNNTGILVQTKNSLTAIKDNLDVFIDFTCPMSTLEYLDFCLQHSKPMVIGTTGFDEISREAIKAASQDIAIVFDANFSTGINIMLKLLEKVAKVINSYTDIRIIEAHHRLKIDSPSGTALKMSEVISQNLDKELKNQALHTCKSSFGKNMPYTIDFATIRAGDIVGEHTAMFVSTDERLEITHKASSRIAFANGAMKSALWIKSKKNGLFNMLDVLNMHEL